MTPLTLHRLNVLVLGVSVAATVGAPAALAAPRAKLFRLPAEPVEQAVLRFALQGDVSVGWSASQFCRGNSRPVQGAMAPERALEQLLPPGCRVQVIDARTFRVLDDSPRNPEARPPRPKPAAAPIGVAAIDELVVTAEKRAEPLIASPFPVSALSGAELGRIGGVTVQSAAAQLGGVAATNLGPGRNKLFVRGLSDGSFTGLVQSTVGLYLDETPITYNAPDPALRLTDVERIEVLRGPQGSLYGSGSIGGIIRIVTNKPDPSRYSASVAVEGALTQRGAPSAAGDVMLNLPLWRGAAVRMVAYDEQLGGYIDNPRRGLTDINQTRRWGGRLSLLIPAGDWRILLSGVHQEIDNADTQYTLGGGVLSRSNRVREPHDNDISVFSATLSRSLRWGDLQITATGVEHRLRTRYDASNAFDTRGPAAFDERQQVGMSMAQAEFTSAPGGRSHWLGGLFVGRARQPQSADLKSLQPPAMRSVYHRRDGLTEAAAYGEFHYDITPRLSATLGGRLFISWLRNTSDTFELQPNVTVRRLDLRDDGFAPKLRLSYAAAPDRVAYFQVQEGFRTGGFNLPLAVVEARRGETFRRRFSPDRLWSYEAGGEAAFLHRTLRVRAAVFYANWRNVQTDQYLASGLPITVNIGDGSNTGIEFDVAWTPTVNWQIRLNGLLENPEITKNARVFPAREDSTLPGVPKRMGAADVRYRWSPRAGFEAAISAQYAYVGRSYLTFEGGPASGMGGYGVGRVAADLAHSVWRLQVYVDNVLDERGDTFAFGDPFVSEAQSTPLRPRTLGVRLERSF